MGQSIQTGGTLLKTGSSGYCERMTPPGLQSPLPLVPLRRRRRTTTEEALVTKRAAAFSLWGVRPEDGLTRVPSLHTLNRKV
jgi:hypothetical protein